MLSFNRSFVDLMRRVVAPHTLLVIDSYDLMDKLNARASELVRSDSTKVILSTCADMAEYIGCQCLAINRLYDPHGACIGHGPRPGFPPIDVQLDELSNYLLGKSVVLIEDGVFTGGTLEFVLKELSARGHSVSDVLIGFCKLNAVDALKRGLNGRVKTVIDVKEVIDWLPFHDIFPLMPHSGRVIGYESGCSPGEYLPMTVGGASFSYPYIEPFGMPGEWAGVSHEAAQEISRFGLLKSIELFELMERLNRRHVLVRDMMRSRHVSLPHRINKLIDPAHTEMRVLDYLRGVLGIFERK